METETLISSALEEICCRGPNGLSLSSLWSVLTPTSDVFVKGSLWTNLLSVPSLQFIVRGNDKPLSATNPKIQRFEDAEKLNLKIVANEHLRDSFYGFYDIPSCSLSRKILERLAIVRTKGMTQDQLAKELGIEGRNFFYRLRKLECQGLIVRQKANVKKNEADAEGETKNIFTVHTNMIYLSRYAKHLDVQQRLEVTMEERNLRVHGNEEETDVGEDGSEREPHAEDVQVKDFLPAMKAICDKLEEANEKALFVSDVKKVLGYTGSSAGHRAWRNICGRLKDAGIVEEFGSLVNGKPRPCLRLLKTLGCGRNSDREKDREVKFGRRLQQTEQLVELPIDHQIYNMINDTGDKGATYIELCERLGLDRKRNDSRLKNLINRFGMPQEKKIIKKTVAFRVWTLENYPENKSKIVPGGNTSTLNVGNRDVRDRSTEAFIQYNHSTSEATSGKLNNRQIDAELCHDFPEDGQTNHELCSPDKLTESHHETMDSSSNAKLGLVSTEMKTNAVSSETTLLKLPDSRSSDSALREQRILERLQDEKFLLKKELHRWLVSFEKEKQSIMDRKSVVRILNKLQQEGRCKCVQIHLPAVTNCTKLHPEMVVLHPSIQSFPPELMNEIYERLRSFEKQIRNQAQPKLRINESIPVLNSFTKTQIHRESNEQVAKAEAMRANGFVLAKMVRAKLLHNFLWRYLSSFPGWDDVLSAGPCGRTYKFFALEEAMKVLPIELFLQVVGSTKELDDMTEKCKRGLHLSDLPVEEYKWLMDTQAKGRLSFIIDILQRLKLIRLVRDGHPEGGVKISHETFMHAMELRPYIEEPVSVIATSNIRSLDLRPRIRHDFILSNREAVDEYWKTLEYCYAATDRRAAIHAFPGSTVPEVCQPRFWTCTRKMSAHQREELLKRITKSGFNKKISLEESVNIAGDLNLSIQQVLLAYNGKLQRHLNIFQGALDANEDPQASKEKLSSKKRKRSLGSSKVKRVRVNAVNEQLDKQRLVRLPDSVDQFIEEKELPPLGQDDDHVQACCEDDCPQSVEEPGLNRDKKHDSVSSRHALSNSQSMCQRRFSWTDAYDRQLLIQYVRHRAVLGANIHRVDWNKLSDLPASPSRCRRRISSLKRNKQFRKALMKLCTVLGKRYAQHLEKTQGIFVNKNDSGVLVRCSTSESVNKFPNGVENAEEIGFEEKHWDDFSDKSIKKALEGVLLCKRMNSVESEVVSSSTLDENIHKDGQRIRKSSAQRSRSRRLHQKFIKYWNEGTFFSTQVHTSLAVSNAVELLKLVFLSSSAASELQNNLAETLRRYSEQDLFSAFSYLRVNKILIGGDGDQPFVLSQQFLQSVSRSSFPSNTGKKAAKFSGWLFEREKDLMEGGISLAADLHCGDVFQLFALVSSGELSISPYLPDEGVGEAEDLRSLKRKAEDDELCDSDKSKKMKSLADSELVSRKEKGFPGIMVHLHRAKLMTVNAVELFKEGGTCIGELHWNDKLNDGLDKKISSSSSQCDMIPEIPNFNSVIPAAQWSSKSPWEAMEGYAKYLMMKPSDLKQLSLFTPEVFRTVFKAVQKAGDQGLSLEEVSQVVGENVHEHIIDVLQAFGYVLKVNAYDSIHVVDALYHSKYFLTSSVKPHSVTKSLQGNSSHSVSHSVSNDAVGSNPSSQREAIMHDNQVHKVTILNCPEEVLPLTESQGSNVHEDGLQDKVILPEQNNDVQTHIFSSNLSCAPILPWMNGNGCIKKVVYNGLVRRVLGIVMQNPGILEDNIIHQIDALNPQSCRTLLDLMILDKHLIVRKMHQSTSSGPPALLGSLLGRSSTGPKSVYREHFFANPMSASML
ncbi:uncharacterized protein LOC105631676 [Jatropha curcas]|uniref:uncharacterized protein LOC105631676 n=1 Tax=Jatropha curcas TaxID=180498 RepID=UPI0009D6B23A|nr:uncharacterized protein LOC105631676 [Jatropha curcas]